MRCAASRSGYRIKESEPRMSKLPYPIRSKLWDLFIEQNRIVNDALETIDPDVEWAVNRLVRWQILDAIRIDLEGLLIVDRGNNE
jgi:hypothetical protein